MSRLGRKCSKVFAAVMAALMVCSIVPAGTLLVHAENGSTLTGKELLKLTLDYCGTMDETKYTEDSWDAFQQELSAAAESYKADTLDSECFYTLRDELEDAKTDLIFITEEESGGAVPFRQLTVDEIVDEMGTGWNLGNTMDGHTGFTPNETLWQNVETTKAMIKSVHDLGFNTVRVPITWGTMINDEDYSIDETWISRVQDIVDYCISQDMYVIINVHHDGAEQTGWLRVAADDIDSVYEKYEGVWRTIADRFRDYDEHLIFESMNEVAGDESTTVPHDTQVIMNLNQIFTNVVRSTGSNNAYRFLSVPARYTNIDNTTKEENAFELPTDTIEHRIFVAVHYYDWQFGMAENTSSTSWSYNSALTLQKDFKKLVDKFSSQGIPVILGEYGVINKNNPEDRAYHVEVVNRLCAQSGVVPVYWDQGWYDRTLDPDYSFTLVDRVTGETVDKTVTDAMLRGFYTQGVEDLSDILLGITVSEISDASFSEERLVLEIGDSAVVTAVLTPENTNDVLLWSTEDETIATVSSGHVRARGIGTTLLHAYSQSGSFEKTIQVTVTALSGEGDCTDIQTGAGDELSLEEGSHVYLDAQLTSDNEGDFLTYQSSNEEVVTVSSIGKVLAKGAGTAYVIITAATGMTRVIPVTVTGKANAEQIELALNVYFNDEGSSYFSNECGQPITVTEDGQYEVTFDCTEDLSANAVSAGVTGLNNLTAIYIKDQAVTEGRAKVSPLDSCNIRYDRIVVDGVELTVTQTESKSALKASGIFDTNDPVNSWDGSQVEEVQVSNHVLNFTGVDNPQQVTVIFTLSDLVFTEGAEIAADADLKTVNEITAPDSVSFAQDTATQQIEISVDGEDGVLLTVVPADASVVMIDSSAVPVEDGKINVSATSCRAGETEVTVYAENGVTAVFTAASSVTTSEGATGTTADEDDAVQNSDKADEASGDQSGNVASEKSNSGINWYLIILIGVAAAVAAGFLGYFVSTKLVKKKK